jgi:hypothetical protein
MDALLAGAAAFHSGAAGARAWPGSLVKRAVGLGSERKSPG